MTTPTAPCQQCCSPRCAGEGLTYNPTTRAYDVCVAPGGGIALDANGCLVNTGGAGPTVVTGGVGTVVNAVPGGYQVTAPPSAAAGNLITTGPDGLAFISCAQLAATCGVGPITAGPGADVTPLPGGGYQVSAAPSTDAGNLLTLGADGNLKITCTEVATCGGGGTPTTVTEGPGIDVAGNPVTGYTISALSTDPGNILTAGTDGRLTLDCPDVAGCIAIDGNPGTPEVDIVGGTGVPGDPWLVGMVPDVTPRARVRTSADTPIGDDTPGGQVITFDTVTYDKGGVFTAGTRLTAPAGWNGVYSMGANIQFRGEFDDNPGFRMAAIRFNGGPFIAFQQQPAVVSMQDSTILNLHTDYEMVAGDYIELIVQAATEPTGPGAGHVGAAANDFSISLWLTFLHR